MSQVTSTNPLSSAIPPKTNSRFNEMSSEDFIKIIFTELTNQDPFQPNDSGALLDQLNSIRSIESDVQLSSKLEDMVFQNQLATSAGMIGKYVQGLTADSQRVDGYVISVLRQDKDVSLQLDSGWQIPAQNIETVLDPEIFN
jgi:flagellar basal-body rod modification protein FlgD